MANRISSVSGTRERGGLKKRPPSSKRDGKSPVESRAQSQAAPGITAQERHRLIAEAAYYIAEQRGFAVGRELDDWLQAEATVAARLRSRVQ